MGERDRRHRLYVCVATLRAGASTRLKSTDGDTAVPSDDKQRDRYEYRLDSHSRTASPFRRRKGALRQRPFVEGPFANEFTFTCENIDRSQDAVLTFQARDVDFEHNTLAINGIDVFDGVPVSPGHDSPKDSGWNSNVLIDDPVRHSLTGSGPGDVHRLTINSRNQDGGVTGNRDDFVIDNIVLMYKTS